MGLVGMCSSVLLFSPCICFVPFAHAALVAHRLGGVDDAGFTEYYQTWLRHWRVDNSIIQRGVTSDNRSRPLAFFPKVVCRVSSRRGASIDVFRSESENAKYSTVVAESQQTYASVSFRIKPNKCTSSSMAPVCESNTKRAATASSAPGNAPQALNHSFHRAGAAHPHLPHRVRAPPHLVFGKSSVWVRRSAINGIELAYTVAQSM